MIRVTILILFLLSMHISNGQNIINDKRLKVLEGQLETALKDRKYEQLSVLASEAILLAEKRGQKDSVYGKILYYRGFSYIKSQEFDKAEKLLKTAEVLFYKYDPKHNFYANTLNGIAILYYTLGKFENAKEYFKKSLEVKKLIYGTDHSEFASTLNNLASVEYAIGNFEEAAELYEQTKAIQKKVLGKKDPSYTVTLNNIGGLYERLGRYSEAEALYLECLNIRREFLGTKHLLYATSLFNLGMLYSNLKLDNEAKPLLLEAATVYKDLLGAESEDYAMVINTTASMYEQMFAYYKAEPLYKEAIAIYYKIFGENHHKYTGALINMASLLNNQKRYDEALFFAQKAYDINKKIAGNTHLQFGGSALELAKALSANGKTKEAEKLFLESALSYEKSVGKKHQWYIKVINELSEFYINTGRKKEALQLIFESIKLNCNCNPGDKINERFYNTIIGSVLTNTDEMLNSLYKLYSFDSELFKSNKYEKILISEIALSLLNKFRASLIGDEDKTRLLQTNNLWIHNILEILDTEKEIEKAFEISEKSKSVLMRDLINTQKAYSYAELPEKLKKKEKELQIKKNALEAQMSELSVAVNNDSLLNLINNVNIEIKKFRALVSSEYPKYADIKYEKNDILSADLKKIIPSNSAVIEYAWGENYLFIFYVDQSNIKITKKLLSELDLDSKIKKFRKSLTDFENLNKLNEVQKKELNTLSNDLYKILLKDIIYKKDKKNLIIIPDGPIAHLPFEALLTELPEGNSNFHNLPYLLNKYSVSYHYSLSLLKENRAQLKKTSNGKIIAFAPDYNKSSKPYELRSPNQLELRKVLSDLPAAKTEVKNLEKAFKGYFCYDLDATEKTFKSETKNYSIIHLAMHGLLNEAHPILSSLAFTEDGDSTENNFLQAYEISKLELNADLVVLSACETGYGRFETGNGTASLARAFMYAGVPSLVVSLWQVNDASTAEIMQLFYANLAKGMDKAEALRQAKLKYIAECKNPMMAHPAFWAAFVQIGDSRPVKIMQLGIDYMFVLYVLGLISVMVMAIYLLYFRLKKSNKVN
jgi:CHAT domain-containing protein/tetratricopeptide (TPR) repeat protein